MKIDYDALDDRMTLTGTPMIPHQPLFKELSELIYKALNSAFEGHGLEVGDVYKMLGEPPNLDMGHLAFPCFSLAKTARKAPPQIAATIAQNLAASDIVAEAKVQGPYLNFTLNMKAVGEKVLALILSGEFFKLKLTDNHQKMMIEYSQPNTHKILHVGHMRNLCLGNALIRMLRYTGHDVLAVTYPGDVGTHVAKCLWYLKYHNLEPIPAENKGAWLGNLYTKAHLKLEHELGSPSEPQNRAELTAILKELHDGKGEFFELWRETREWSINLMQEAYDWADVKFDRWFWESEVDAPSLKYVSELYEQGKLVKDNGAIGMDLSEDNLGFCLLIKSDGTGLYSTKDVELARKKFEEYGVDHSIYIVDNRQAYHFKQVFKVLEKLGFENAKNCYHLQYDVVELPDGAMSSRKGNIVPLMTLIESMQKEIKEKYLSKYEGDWSAEEIENTAKDIAAGAIKYGMIRVDNNRKIIFDLGEWLALDGETGPYLQYVCARINSLCNRLGPVKNDVDWSLLSAKEEVELALKVQRFNDVALGAAENFKTATLTSYLFELGKLFNSFYANCEIGTAATVELKETRLALAEACGKVMKTGLAIIGIHAPDRM